MGNPKRGAVVVSQLARKHIIEWFEEHGPSRSREMTRSLSPDVRAAVYTILSDMAKAGELDRCEDGLNQGRVVYLYALPGQLKAENKHRSEGAASMFLQEENLKAMQQHALQLLLARNGSIDGIGQKGWDEKFVSRHSKRLVDEIELMSS